MRVREVLLATLTEQFSDHGLRAGSGLGAIAVVPAKHPDVGEVIVEDTGIATNVSAIVTVGDIIVSHFTNYDSHLDGPERAKRLTTDVVRFLRQLFDDRLLFWRSTDGRNAGWRERGDLAFSEPLVLDNRIYRLYVWSGPMAVWQAIPAVFARGRIRDDREHEIVACLLEDQNSVDLQGAERDLARRLVADYQRERAQPGT